MKGKYKLGLVVLIWMVGIFVLGNSEEARAASGIIGENQAESIACKDAKQKKKNVTFKTTELEKSNNIMVYEVEFYTKKWKYEYDIQASNGKILGYSVERRTVKSTNSNHKISKGKAKKAALKHAGVKNKKATFTKVKTDRDDGMLIYEIKFRTANKKYEYELQASNGKVLSYSMDRLKMR